MLTRLRVSGFKNLLDVDVRFGPFTCIAGGNGVGKSNLFDAIRFLSALADDSLMEAAISVRADRGRTSDVQSLFHCQGDQHAQEMSFEVEMIVPSERVDDLGQPAQATTTFLRYSLLLGYRRGENVGALGALELLKEELVHIRRGDAHKHLLFPHVKKKWRDSAVTGRRTGTHFISTEGEGENRIVQLHQDGGSRGRPVRQAVNLPRTVLSVANAAESPTALLARREMQSWRLLQLEPSALRKPDEFSAPTTLGPDGSHLAAALYRLAHDYVKESDEAHDGDPRVYARIANRLAELLGDVTRVSIDRDETRELLTLYLTANDDTAHAARALSDGTLRFLALAVLDEDQEAQGVLCLEEPENGIHPARIPAMLRLLQDIATDVNEPVGEDNPLRQVIINTHSPAVVKQIPDDSLLIAELRETIRSGERSTGVLFSCLPDTWRATKTEPEEAHICRRGKLLAYLNPVLPEEDDSEPGERPCETRRIPKRRRVVDRKDLQEHFPFFSVKQ